ncbi:MAG: YfhO family protein [Saprospiraceae bacterium]
MDFKKFLPHLIAVAALMLVAAVYFAPNAFNGKVLSQPDNDRARAMQTETRQFLEKEGKAPLWTNSPFGGMPAYQIYSSVQGNLTKPLYKSLFLWTDYTAVWAQVFVAMFCMYLLLSVFKADWRVAIFGALAFGITSYNIDIIEAGHSTKMAALALAPGVLAGAALIFNGRLLLGGGILALFTAMQLYANHVQITYYSLLLIGVYSLAQLIDAIRHKTLINWVKQNVVIGLVLLIGFACNLSRLWPTYEYSQETIRGKSELKKDAARGDGLNKDYLFGWSYGVGESFTLLIPHHAGGGANESFKNTELYKTFVRKYSQQLPPQQADQQTAALMYTGDQPFVGTAIYFGAIVCFLFLLGAFLVQGNTKWWLFAGGMFMVSLAWGRNFNIEDWKVYAAAALATGLLLFKPLRERNKASIGIAIGITGVLAVFAAITEGSVFNLNFFLYEHFPMFNKFRAVSMALGMGQLCFAALAALGLQKICDPDISVEQKKRALWMALGTTGVLFLIAAISRSDTGPRDEMLAQVPDLMSALQKDRSALWRGDAFRSLGFILAAVGLIWFYLKGSLKANLTVVAIALLALTDHWFVCNRTLDSSKYVEKKEATAPPKEEAFDLQIKQDKDLHYRVLDYARGKMTANAIASYFHKSLSGYHAAKLQRYQDVVDKYFGDVYPQDERMLPGVLQLAGLFNVKYLVKPTGEVVPNTAALGNAWFVKGWKTAPNGDEELDALARLNFRDSAVVQQSFASTLEGLNIQPDSNATIRLTSYHPDKMEYEYSAATEQLALFSEMWYPPAKGWKCYLNGQPAPDFIKADYLIRAMRLPAGQNQKLEMRFEPRSFYLGETVSMAASVLALLLFFGGLFFWYRRHPLGDPNQLADVEPEKKEKSARVAPAPPMKSAGKKKK